MRGTVSRTLRSPVVLFALSGLLAVVVVGVVAFVLVQRNAQDEALRDAKATTRTLGEGLIAPSLDPGILRGDPRSIERLDRIVRYSVLKDPVVRVKLWSADGRILYSDEPRLIGERYELEDEEREAMRRKTAAAELSSLNGPENRFERRDRRLREVYLGIDGPDGTKLLFETYQTDASIEAAQRRVRSAALPVLVGALLLLWLVQLPIAAAIGVRLNRSRKDREDLLKQAVTASERERRRIARDLHDGVVQDLAGVSYTLRAAKRRPELLGEAGDSVRAGIRQLRTLLLELYPESLERQGLKGALDDLVSRLDGLETHVEIADDTALTPAQEQLAFRVAREALRNVQRHAHASCAGVILEPDGTLTITDDGRGFPAADDDRPRFGLRMLEDLAREQGAQVRVTSAAGMGTTVELRFDDR